MATDTQDTYDFIIVGGGSAGCVLAEALSRCGKHEVLMVEEGRRDTNPWLHVPGTFFKAWGTPDMAAYASESDPSLADRPHVVPIGRVIGGGSSVNGMIYMRGQAQDYDDWADQHGCAGWRYQDVLPVFREQENNSALGGPYHGQSGHLPVCYPGHRHVVTRAAIDAACALGIPRNDDFNGEQQAGAGYYQATIRGGRRMSAAVAFLKPALKRANLTVATETTALGVHFNGRRASGVDIRHNGVVRRVTARREIVLAAGAFVSPRLLMLSGIGPAEHLLRHGIDLLQDAPDVGGNFQDHVGTPVTRRLKDPIGLYGQDKGLKALRNGLEYMLTRKGLLASNLFEAGACVDTDGDGRPDVQMNFSPFATTKPGQPPLDFHAVQINPMTMRPRGRGRLELDAANRFGPPRVVTRMLGDPEDMDTLRRGIRLAREIYSQSPLRDLVTSEIWPGENISSAKGSNALDDAIAREARTIYHPAGTCRMGGDGSAVVDAQLRVNGVEGLRVADCSVMPALVSGNTNAPTMMIAGRAAAFILADHAHAG